jgi:uncharacterized protein
MLVEVRITNFRSFKDEQVFSLVADTGTEHERTHTIAATEKGFRPLLRSAAIYGANSAGKTNILRALLFVKELVMGSANSLPGAPIQFTPYAFEKKYRSSISKFEITFIERGVRYEYAVSVDAERIHFERLIEYPEGKPRQLFLREYLSDGKYFWDLNKNYLKGSKTNWRDNTKPNSLFLSVAVLNNSQQLLPAFEWFQKRLVVIAGNTKMNPVLTMQMLDTDPTAKARVLAFLREADPGITDLKIERQTVPPGAVVFASRNVLLERAQSGETRTAKASFLHSGGRSKDQLELTSEDESGGALALFESAGAWLNVLSNGEVLLFDEMDSSLHPFLVHFLVQQFHSPKRHAMNAQLVFTTHNSFLLNQDIFRRDQIWFVEKQFSGESRLYPLTRFMPRKDTENIQKWYFQGRYGALPILEEYDLLPEK